MAPCDKRVLLYALTWPDGITSLPSFKSQVLKGRIWYTTTVVASAVHSRWARCTELAGDSQRYNGHPFSADIHLICYQKVANRIFPAIVIS
jgi:hypothetical protein